jgi:diacylglycerol kinase (ATP)
MTDPAHASPRRWTCRTGSRILIVLNPAAGNSRLSKVSALMNALRDCGFVCELLTTTRRGDAETFAAQADAGNCDLVISAGGDGTVNEVLNGLAMSPAQVPLAVFPLGSANVLAAELGLPADPEGFARAIATWRSKPAWLGEVNGRRFALMASVGFDAWVVRQLNPTLKRYVGRAAYGIAGLKLLAHPVPLHYRVRIHGETIEAAGVIVCKSRFYGGRFVVSPDAAVSAPSLYVCILPRATRSDIVRYAARLADGRGLQRAAGVIIRAAQRVEIDGPETEPVQVDGDIVTTLPAVARLVTQPIELVMA